MSWQSSCQDGERWSERRHFVGGLQPRGQQTLRPSASAPGKDIVTRLTQVSYISPDHHSWMRMCLSLKLFLRVRRQIDATAHWQCDTCTYDASNSNGRSC